MDLPLIIISTYLPGIIAVIATLLFWSRISNRMLFLVTALLSLLGLQSIGVSVARFVYLQVVFKVATGTDQLFTQHFVVVAAVQLLLGIPFAWWLSNIFRKA